MKESTVRIVLTVLVVGLMIIQLLWFDSRLRDLEGQLNSLYSIELTPAEADANSVDVRILWPSSQPHGTTPR